MWREVLSMLLLQWDPVQQTRVPTVNTSLAGTLWQLSTALFRTQNKFFHSMGEKTVLATGFYPELWVQADFVGQLLTRFSHLSQLTKKKWQKRGEKEVVHHTPLSWPCWGGTRGQHLQPWLWVDKSFQITQGQSKGQETVWVRLWSSWSLSHDQPCAAAILVWSGAGVVLTVGAEFYWSDL